MRKDFVTVEELLDQKLTWNLDDQVLFQTFK